MRGLLGWFTRSAAPSVGDLEPGAPGSDEEAVGNPSTRVLVIDDNDPMRALILRTLRQYFSLGEVLEADNVEAAGQLLSDEAIDLVLCDWRMPGSSGIELLETLRARGWPGVFGFVTAESGAAATSRALQAGASFVLAKPFRGEELADRIAIAFGGSASLEASYSVELSDRASRVAALLEGTLGTAVTVTVAEEPPRPRIARMATRYVGVGGEDAAICIAELPLVVAAGAALALFPPSVAKEWTASGSLPETLKSNYHEVANVLSQVARDDGGRCAIADLTLYAPGETPTGDHESAHELNLEVDIVAYGSGRLSLTDR